MDTSMREIVCGVLRRGQDVPAVERVPNDEEMVRRLFARLGDPRLVACCYEAGRSGYELHRLGLRAGILTPIRVPSREEEAVRDLVRARADLLADRKRAQQRLNAFPLRHGRVWAPPRRRWPPGRGRGTSARRWPGCRPTGGSPG
jgi:transposase